MANNATKVGNIRGPKGQSFLQGTGAPSAAVIAAAAANDTYLDVSTGDLYTFA